MNLILHIIQKDLRRMRGWLLVWAVVLLLPVFLGMRVLAGEPATEAIWKRLTVVSVSLIWLQAFVAFLLTIVLVQEDGLVGSRQFWLVRPIAAWRLLGAKLAGIVVLLVGVPVVVLLPWWLWCGFGLPDIARVTVEWILPMLLLAVPAAFVATVTDTFGRAILWTVALAAIVMVSNLVFIVFNAQAAAEPGLIMSRVATAAMAFFPLVMLATGGQFFLRRQGWTIGLAVFAAALSLLIAILWPWQWIGGNEPNEFAPARAAEVKVNIGQATRWAETGREQMDMVSISFVATGVPADSMLMGVGAHQSWQWDRISIERWGWGGAQGGFTFAGLKQVDRDAETERWQKEEARKRWPGMGMDRYARPENWELNLNARVPRSLAARMVNEPSTFKARMWLQAVRPILVFEMAVRPGEKKRARGFSSRIESVTRSALDTRAVLVDTAPMLWSEPLQYGLNLGAWFRIRKDRGYFALNRERGEFFGANGSYDPVVVQGVTIAWRTIRFHDRVIRDGKWVERSLWNDRVTLGLAMLQEESLFSRDISVERLPVKEFRRAPTP